MQEQERPNKHTCVLPLSLCLSVEDVELHVVLVNKASYVVTRLTDVAVIVLFVVIRALREFCWKRCAGGPTP